MNEPAKKLTTILENAEVDVLEMISLAARAQDYAMIDRARSVAESLRNITSQLKTGTSTVNEPQSASTPLKKRRSVASKKGEYPRFKVADGSLFKTGWSKKKNSEYVQRVPIGKVKKIVAAIEQLSSAPSPISSEHILESESMENAGSPPSYQVYIVLAFLKQEGVIASTGREGFHLSSDIMRRTQELLRETQQAP